MLADDSLDAIIIATPGSTHAALAKQVLQAGKHALIEKPVAFSLHEAERLARLAGKNSLTLMAGHIHLYNSAIHRLKMDVVAGKVGRVLWLDSRGTGGPVRADMSALWDYCPHDISILRFLLGHPQRVTAHGVSFRQHGIEDVVTLTLNFRGTTFASVLGTWLHPEKRRSLVLIGTKRSAFFDDYATRKLVYRTGNYSFTSPKLSSGRPLTLQIEEFVRCIRTGREPLTGPREFTGVTAVLEAAQQSLATGKPVSIPQGL